MFALAKKLRQAGVLGLNERNAEYISRMNPRRLFPRVDDKVLTKQLAIDAGMAVPELYGGMEKGPDAPRPLPRTVSRGREVPMMQPQPHQEGVD